MAYYFASDVHLRFDRPDRDRRFNAWLNRLTPEDALLIVGDLCDFWMAARKRASELVRCESLKTLAQIGRRGGSLAIMPGNHDAWLCPFYANELGAQILPDPYDLRVYGSRLHLVHGHLLGARRAWKGWMESHAFFDGFGRMPKPLAKVLDSALTWNNDRKLEADEDRHLRVFRAYASRLDGVADLVVMGHVHRAVDDAQSRPRMIVLGGWQNARSSFLKVDDSGASFHVEHDRDRRMTAAPTGSQPFPTRETGLHED